MSAELITILSAFITLGIGMAGSHAWMVRRIDASIGSVRTEIASVRSDLGARIDKVDERLEALGRDITDVKVSVARWEGPRPHLLTAK